MADLNIFIKILIVCIPIYPIIFHRLATSGYISYFSDYDDMAQIFSLTVMSLTVVPLVCFLGYNMLHPYVAYGVGGVWAAIYIMVFIGQVGKANDFNPVKILIALPIKILFIWYFFSLYVADKFMDLDMFSMYCKKK